MERTYVEDEKSSSTTSSLYADVRSLIWSYFRGEHNRALPPPDRNIVERCVAALHGHTSEELRLYLNARIRQGFGAGRGKGPKSYAWFPAVIESGFGPRE